MKKNIDTTLYTNYHDIPSFYEIPWYFIYFDKFIRIVISIPYLPDFSLLLLLLHPLEVEFELEVEVEVELEVELGLNSVLISFLYNAVDGHIIINQWEIDYMIIDIEYY